MTFYEINCNLNGNTNIAESLISNDIRLQEIVKVRAEEKIPTQDQFQQSIVLNVDKLKLFLDQKYLSLENKIVN